MEKAINKNILDFILHEPLSEEIAEWLRDTSHIFNEDRKYGIIIIYFKDKAGAMEFKLRFS